MPLAVKINVALREQNCQKIGSERVKEAIFISYRLIFMCFDVLIVISAMHYRE